MAAYLRLGPGPDVKGESTDQDHTGWIIIESMSAAIHRSIPPGAKDQQRTKGETSLGDVVCVRQLDKSSTKLAEACATGKFFKDAELHLTSDIAGKRAPYLKYVLKDVIVSSYSFHGNSSGSPLPSEEVTLGFSGVEWTYIILDPKTGDNKGNVPGKYDPSVGSAS